MHVRVRISDGDKGALQHECEEEGPAGVPLAYCAGGCNVNSAGLAVGDGTYCGMSAEHEVRKSHKGWVPGCHSSETLGPVGGTEGVRPVVGEHHSAV
jgi:hypothetical protein